MNVPQILTLVLYFAHSLAENLVDCILKTYAEFRHFLPPPWYQLPCKLPLLQISTNSIFDSPWFHPCPHIIQQSEWYSRSNHITPLLQRPSDLNSAELLSRLRLFVTPLTAAIRLPCPSPSPRACSNSCPSSWWCYPTISSSVIPFSCIQSSPASGLFQTTSLFLPWEPHEQYEKASYYFQNKIQIFAMAFHDL